MTYQPEPPTTTRKHKPWPWIIAAAVVAVLAAAGTTYALTDTGKDSGVVACERAAQRAASGENADSSDDGDVQLLKDSRHADLREVGEAIERTAAEGDMAEALTVGVRMMAACAEHGVIIKPGG